MSAARDLPEFVISEDSHPVLVPRKAEIPSNATILVSSLLERMSAKEAYVIVYARTKVEEEALKQLAEKAIIGLQGSKETIFGAELSTRNKPAEYVYSDPKLELMRAEMENLKSAIKEREKFNQALPSEGTYDPEAGVLIQRPVKNEKGVTIAVTLA